MFALALALGTIGIIGYAIFIGGPRETQLKLDEENNRLLDREMLRSMYAHQQNEEKILESLIKKTFVKVQSLDQNDDGLQVKSNAEKILKVIGK